MSKPEMRRSYLISFEYGSVERVLIQWFHAGYIAQEMKPEYVAGRPYKRISCLMMEQHPGEGAKILPRVE